LLDDFLNKLFAYIDRFISDNEVSSVDLSLRALCVLSGKGLSEKFRLDFLEILASKVKYPYICIAHCYDSSLSKFPYTVYAE